MIPAVTQLNESKNNTISCFDIDDAILFSKSQIYIKLPGKDWKGVSTEQFAEDRTKYPKDTEYDFKDFREYDRILYSIVGAKPNIKVLMELDNAINLGHKIGIITARGGQKAVWKGLNSFLLYRNKKGELQPLPPGQFKQAFVFAVNDPATQKALGAKSDIKNPSEAKAYILQRIFGDTMNFANIIFYDDDRQNVLTVNNLNDPRIKAIQV